MYKSLPETEYERRRIINELSAKYDLRGVPGFYRKYGEWHMYSADCGGFLIPVCNKDGYIQGMQTDLILIKNGIGGFLLMSIRRGQVSPLGYIL